MERTRKEHIDFCKKRALEYLNDNEYFSLQDAFNSIMNDLTSHKETRTHPAIETGLLLMANGCLDTKEEMKKFIEGFN